MQLLATHAFCTQLDLRGPPRAGVIAATQQSKRIFADLVLISQHEGRMWKFIYQRRGAARRVIAFVGGAYAVQLDQDDNAAYNAALSALAAVLGLPANPAYLDEAGLVLHRTTTHWSTEPWSRGAYSYTVVNANGPRTTLRRARVHGRLVFAGEATWVEEPGTLHGALYSGELAARLLLLPAEA